jgi:glycosyltransferase involved in cell wall biosynthesis
VATTLITNTPLREFDVIEVTNEMPLNRIGGVGSAIESLMSGFRTTGTRALWFVTDHHYHPFEVDRILASYPSVAIGASHDLRRFRAPVAHIHCYTSSPMIMKMLRGMRVIFTVHSLIALEERSNNVDLSQGVRFQESLIAASSEVVVTSEAERRHYLELGYDRLNPRINVIHNGLRPPPAYRRIPHQWLGFCGRLVPRKHPEYVQMVLREPGFEAYQALIAGKFFSTYARELVRKHGLESRVHYLGWCGGERLEAFYRSIDVLAVPSIYEPFGMTPLEAAARRIPVVCTRVDGLREVLGEFAFYSDGDTYDAFRLAMHRWRTATGEAIHSIVDGAWRRYRDRFTDVAMARRYERRFNLTQLPRGKARS